MGKIILTIILGYILVAILSIWIHYRFIESDKKEALFFGTLWPGAIGAWTVWLIGKGIIWLRDKIINLWEKWENLK